jgi:hypothetical protein
MNPLPAPVAAYIDAANAQDPGRVAAAFCADATVHDEGHVQRGRAAIEAWARDTGSRYQSTIEPAGLESANGRHSVRANVRGNFPGSPITLHFHFQLESDGIASLEIAS